MTTYQIHPNPRFIALIGMPYQWSDPDFHLKMAVLGIKRGDNCCTGMPHKAIITSATSYWLDDYDSEPTMCNAFHIIPTYTVEDFVREIKKLKSYE